MSRWRTIAVVACVPALGCAGDGGPATTGGEEAATAASEAAAPDHRQAGLPFALTDRQAEGRDVYETVCWTCHGTAGRGDGPAVQAGSVARPPDFTTGEYPDLTAEQLLGRFEAALEGADPAHPHMKFVTSILREEVFAAALSYVPVVGYPPEMAASAVTGGALYIERCSGCHGIDGEGDGPVASRLTVEPADFTTDSLIAAGDFDALYRRIREGGGDIHGSSMPAWGLLYDEDAMRDLAAYVATFQEGVFGPPPTGR